MSGLIGGIAAGASNLGNAAGTIGSASGGGILDALLGGISDWKQRLLPASFRGVPFYVRGHQEGTARRGAVHEFPLRDRPQVEDLGAAAGRYELTAYVLADDYFPARDALRQAMSAQAGPGTLSHPYLGSLTVQPMACSLREDVETGRMAVFHLTFVDAGVAPASYASVDSASALLAAIGTVVSDLKLAFTLGTLIASHPGFLRNALLGGVEDLVGGLLGLSVGSVAAIRNAFVGISTAGADTTALPLAVTGAFAAAAGQLVDAPPAAITPSGMGDITGGLGAFASFVPTHALAPNLLTANRVQQATNAQALQDLVCGAAVLAAATIYAQTDFPSQPAALAAQQQLLGWIDQRADAAAAAGADALYGDWISLAGTASADLIQRAQALPLLGGYQLAGPVPSLVLAVRLYPDDATQYQAQAEALELLNGVAHPAFMPPSGAWLMP